jgi:RNA polymerase sigma factor (sigma-70 family)
MKCYGADAEDFQQMVYLAVLERRIVAKLEAAVRPHAFLYAVVANLYRDVRVKQWGKQRPSAKARSLGQAAVKLEELIERRRLSAREAVETLAAARSTAASREELETLVRELPCRLVRPFVGGEGLDHAVEERTADWLVLEAEKRARRRAVMAVLRRLLRALPPEDQYLLQLRFWGRASVPRLSVMLGIEPRALYAHLYRLRDRLRDGLRSAGLRASDAGEVLAAWDGPLDREDSFEQGAEMCSPAARQEA